MNEPVCEVAIPVKDYDLAATLTSGQAFRWNQTATGWHGVIQDRWVELTQRIGEGEGRSVILARFAGPPTGEDTVRHYLQTHVEMQPILDSFPSDPAMNQAILKCHGLRLLRQDPWECLASFILSSTKQIVQIRQIVSMLCERFGEVLPGPGGGIAHAFPTATRLAACGESDLRACKMGFRAPYLLGSAKAVATGGFDLEAIRRMSREKARAQLMTFPGVGGKIADCVLLFAYGYPDAFPVDVWVEKAIRRLYFQNRKVDRKRIEKFCRVHFGRNSGYAQQYLFHYMRLFHEEN